MPVATLTHYSPLGVAHEYRPNKFPGKCAGCGGHVPGNEGELTGSKQAGWKVSHLPGMCPAPKAEQASAQPAASVVNTLPPLPAQPYVIPAKPKVTVTPGVFKLGSDIYVVKPWAHDHSRLYAWRLVESAPRKTLAGTIIPFRLVKAYGAVYKLTEDMRLSLADANEISARYGKCMCCARALYAADTIVKCEQTGVWVGPDCRKAYFPQTV